jgi:hypothetical protein
MQEKIDTSQQLTQETKNQVLLIDLENCPSQINVLLKDLEQFSQVLICYAQSGAKIPLDWLMPLTAMVNAERLKIIKMPSGGKNAADFGICFFAGVLMQQLSLNTHFVIMSEDTDLDHVIKLLRSQGRTATRINVKKEEKVAAIANAATYNSDTSVQSYCQNLLINNQNRPSTKTTLLNSLKNHCTQDMSQADAAFKQLNQAGAITVALDEKISYNDTKIANLVKR